MFPQISSLTNRLLTAIDQEADYTDLHAVCRCKELSLMACKELATILTQVDFTSDQAEIKVFKNDVPLVLSLLLHFEQVERVLLHNPISPTAAQVEYLDECAKRLNLACKDDPALFAYYRLCRSDRDTELFTRKGNAACPVITGELLFAGFGNICPASISFAKITAAELTLKLLPSLYPQTPTAFPTVSPELAAAFQWTGSKTDLAELIYALQEYGVFNHTKMEISKVVEFFENTFQIKIGNIYKIYENIRLRKKNRTTFLDELRTALLRRMESDDLHAL